MKCTYCGEIQVQEPYDTTRHFCLDCGKQIARQQCEYEKGRCEDHGDKSYEETL